MTGTSGLAAVGQRLKPSDMCRELRLPGVVLGQLTRECDHPVANLHRKVRSGSAHHLGKLGLVGHRIDVFANRHGPDLATVDHAGDRR